MIVFLSDNGASSMGKGTGSINHSLAYNSVPENFEDIAKHIDDFGSEKAGTDYPAGWAQVSIRHLSCIRERLSQAERIHLLIVYYPKMIKDKGGIRKQFVHVSDIVPTVYDVIGVEAPKEIDGLNKCLFKVKVL